MKITIVRTAIFCTLILPSIRAIAAPQSTVYTFNIPRESVNRALIDIAAQSGLQVARLTDPSAATQIIGPLTGRFTLNDALTRLLTGSELSYRMVNSRTIAIEVRAAKTTSRPRRPVAAKTPKAGPADSTRLPLSAPAGNLADIVISATRVAGSLEFAPVAANTLDGSALQEENLTGLTGITTAVPDFTFRAAPSLKDQGFVLRGLGTISTSPGVEPSVSTVVDGVVLARQGQAMMNLLDIDHIDVLKGPQGTLFGMNSSGGVIKIVTKQPSFQPSGHIDFGYFDADEFRSQASFTGPIASDRVAARASFMVDSYPGNVLNVYNGDNERINGYQDYGARTQFLIRGAGSARFLITTDYTHTYETTPQGVFAQIYNPAFASVIAPAAAGPDSREVNSNYNTYDLDTNYGYALTADWNIGELRATSITAFRDWTNVQYQDIGRAPGLFIGFPQEDDLGKLWFQQVSEEFRVATQGTRRLDYVAGLFLFEGRDHENYQRATTAYSGGATANYLGFADYGTVNRNGAVFGDATLHLTRHLSAIAGARLIHEELGFNFGRVANVQKTVPGIQPAFAATGSTDDTNYMGRLGLQANLPVGGIAYLTWSRGYKGPAYNPAFSMLPQDTIVVRPEISHDWEAGIKMPVLGHSAHVDLSLFHDTVMDFQVPWHDVYNDSPITRLINAGQVTTQGVELGFVARPFASVSLHGDAAYDPTRIDHFSCPPGTSAGCNVTGKPLPYQPEWQGVLGFDLHGVLTPRYRWLFGMDGRAQTNVQYSINETPQTIQGGYAIINGYAGIDSDDGWQLRVLVKNIADRFYSSYLAYSANYLQRFVPRDDHRYFGISIHKEF